LVETAITFDVWVSAWMGERTDGSVDAWVSAWTGTGPGLRILDMSN